jgi:hypothetical protein
MLAGFDALSFPISAGVLFLLFGLAGSIRAIANADGWMREIVRPDPDTGGVVGADPVRATRPGSPE